MSKTNYASNFKFETRIQQANGSMKSANTYLDHSWWGCEPISLKEEIVDNRYNDEIKAFQKQYFHTQTTVASDEVFQDANSEEEDESIGISNDFKSSDQFDGLPQVDIIRTPVVGRAANLNFDMASMKTSFFGRL